MSKRKSTSYSNPYDKDFLHSLELNSLKLGHLESAANASEVLEESIEPRRLELGLRADPEALLAAYREQCKKEELRSDLDLKAHKKVEEQIKRAQEKKVIEAESKLEYLEGHRDHKLNRHEHQEEFGEEAESELEVLERLELEGAELEHLDLELNAEQEELLKEYQHLLAEYRQKSQEEQEQLASIFELKKEALEEKIRAQEEATFEANMQLQHLEEANEQEKENEAEEYFNPSPFHPAPQYTPGGGTHGVDE